MDGEISAWILEPGWFTRQRNGPDGRPAPKSEAYARLHVPEVRRMLENYGIPPEPFVVATEIARQLLKPTAYENEKTRLAWVRFLLPVVQAAMQ